MQLELIAPQLGPGTRSGPWRRGLATKPRRHGAGGRATARVPGRETEPRRGVASAPPDPTCERSAASEHSSYCACSRRDAENRLISITYPNGTSTTFAYDGFSRRVQIIEKNASNTITSTKNFVWCGTTICEERDASNNVTKRFFSQGEQINGTSYFFSRDHLGSVREMTDSSGNIQARYDYDPYGRTTLVQGTNIADFQYAGMYEHLPSGLNLTPIGNTYDPTVGHWIGRDPLGEEASLNLYAYVGDNPMIFIDPLGLLTQEAQAYVDQALKDNDGDLGNAWLELKNKRENGHHEFCEPLRDAEHYLYAAYTGYSLGIVDIGRVYVGTAGYYAVKSIEQATNSLPPYTSPPSINETLAGYEGLGQGIYLRGYDYVSKSN